MIEYLKDMKNEPDAELSDGRHIYYAVPFLQKSTSSDVNSFRSSKGSLKSRSSSRKDIESIHFVESSTSTSTDSDSSVPSSSERYAPVRFKGDAIC